jgi:uncharacterized membrane protein YfcA
MSNQLFLAFVALIAGAMNAVAGGGTFISLPALISAGVPSVAANMTSTLALCPGTFASAFAYRRDFRAFGDASPWLLLSVSLIGGAAGALLLIYTPSSAFDAIVPWLLLAGAVAFAFGARIGTFLRARMTLGKPALLAVQFAIGIYGGYFGAAVGLMMLAAWTIFGAKDLRAMAAVRTLAVSVTNAMAILFFIAIGQIFWREAAVMLVGGLAGGYFGARAARLLPQDKLRLVIAWMNFAMTAAMFWKTYG